MAPKKAPPPIKDEVGRDWQARADAAWAQAMENADGDSTVALGMYLRKRRDAKDEPDTAQPALPTFDDEKHPSVRREAFGRFVADRGAGVVHDVYNPGSGCDIDKIEAATFYHFGHEVPEDLTRHECVEVEANA